MTADTNRIDELVAWAETEFMKESGSAWKQDAWVTPNVPECGTAYCLAGKAVSDAGYPMLLETLPGDGMLRYTYDPDAKDGRGRTIEEVAIELLGLTETQAEVLFFANNSIEDLKMCAKAIANGENLEEERNNLY